MQSSGVLIICESETDSRLLRMILDGTDRAKNTEFFAADQELPPHMLLSVHGTPKGVRGGMLGWLKRKAEPYGGAIVVFDLKFGSPTQPAPFGGRLNGIWLAPAVPSVESWLLTDPEVFRVMSVDMSEQVRETFETYLGNGDFHFFNSKFLNALTRKKIVAAYDPHRAAILSPSLRSFLKLVDASHGRSSAEFKFNLPAAIISNLILEYYPPDQPIYRALDGSTLTGQEMAREVQAGTDLGLKYSSDILRVCRDLLARQAQRAVRAAE
jgi:hypothetical protein